MSQVIATTDNQSAVMEKIAAIADELEAEAVPSEELGKLTDRAVALLQGADVTKVFLATELGGMGMYPGEAFPILDRVSQVDGSIGWVNTIFAAAGNVVGFLSEDASRELYRDEEPLFGVVSNGGGQAVKVDGGWRVTGAWRYASGSKHASYIFCPAMKVVDGEMVPMPAGYGFFLVPTSQISYGGGWDTLGLRATGSVDVSCADAFVQEKHVANLFAPPQLGGRAAAGGFFVLVSLMHLGFATGITRRLLDEIALFANRPATRPGAKPVAEGERFRVEYAKKEMEAAAARALVVEVLADIDDTLRDGGSVSRRQTSMLKGASIHAHDVARDVATWAFRRGGGVALRDGALQRAIRDALAGCQHFIVDDSHLAGVGHDLLGAPDNFVWMGVDFVELPPQPVSA